MSASNGTSGPVIVGIGEALFDQIPGNGAHLGGAPLNFAVHAKQMLAARPSLGGRSVLVSRVGNDELGARLRTALQGFGVETAALQTDPDRATGIVDVRIGQGGPHYRIRDESAWDGIAFTEQLDTLSRSFDAACFGTLARRRAASASTIEQFVRNGVDRDAVRMYDINLRPGAMDHDVIVRGLELASIAKMNDEELPVVADMIGATPGDEAHRATAIIRAFDLKQVMLTRGARGVIVYAFDGTYEGAPAKADLSSASDAVGAGDSCGAAYVVRTLCGDDPYTAASVANRVGAYVASRSGATPSLPSHILGEHPAASVGTSSPIVPAATCMPFPG
ncbi:MAG: PfkB family carbohydrate kinase [Planctomycetota bacterium]